MNTMTRMPSIIRTLLAVALLVVAPATLSGCVSCQEKAINPETPEQAIEFWSGLICDRRNNIAGQEVSDIENRQEVAIVTAQLMAGDVPGEELARYYGELEEFIKSNGNAVMKCEAEIIDKTERDGDKYLVEVVITWGHVLDDNGDFEVKREPHYLELETTKIDGYWRITGLPPNTPSLEDYRLVRQVGENPRQHL